MFSQTRLFYLTVKVVHRSKRRQDDGRIERGENKFLWIFCWLNCKITSYYNRKPQPFNSNMHCGWTGKLCFTEGNKELEKGMKQNIPLLDEPLNNPLSQFEKVALTSSSSFTTFKLLFGCMYSVAAIGNKQHRADFNKSKDSLLNSSLLAHDESEQIDDNDASIAGQWINIFHLNETCSLERKLNI